MRGLLRVARRLGQVVLVLVAIGLGLVDLSLGLLRTSAGAAWVRDALLARVNRGMAGRLTMAKLHVVGPQITVEGVRLLDPSGAPVAELDRLALRWSPWALAKRRLEVSWLSVSGPRLWLRRAADGTSNLGRALAGQGPAAPATSSRGSGGPPGFSFQLGSLVLDGGLVVVRDERGGGPWRVEGIVGRGHGHWQAKAEAGGLLLDVRGDVTEPRELPFHVRLDAGANLAASGAAVDSGLLVELGDSELRLLATLEPVLPGPLTGGKVEVHATVESLRLAPTLARLFVPTWPLVPAVVGTGEARWNAETGEASGRLDLRAGKLRVGIVGTGDTRARALHEVELQAHAIDLAELLGNGVASDFSLGLAASVHAAAGGWQGTGVLDVPSGRLDGHAFGPVHLRAEVDGDRWRIGQARASLPGLRLQARGGGSASDLGVGIDLALDDLAVLLTSLGAGDRAGARGHGDLHLWLGGSPRRPGVRLTGQLAGLSWQDVHVPKLEIQVAVPDVRRPLAANARVQVPEGQVGARPLHGLALQLRATGPRLDATLALGAPVAVHASAAGVWQHGQRELRLDRCTVQADGTTWALSRSARLVVAAERVAVRELRLAGQAGQSLALDLDRRGNRLDANVVLALALGRLPRALLPRGLRIGGDLQVEAALHRRGPRDELDAKAALARGRVADLDGVSLAAEVHARDQRATGQLDAKLAGTEVAARFDGLLAWPWSPHAGVLAEVDVAGVDLAVWRRRLQPLLARQPSASAGMNAVAELGGQAHVHGLLDSRAQRPRLALSLEVARLRARDLDLGDLAVHLDAQDARPLRATIQLSPHGDERQPAGRLSVEATLARPLAELLSPSLSPERLASAPLHARVRLERLAMKPLAALAPSTGAWDGFVDASLALDGSLVSPVGELELSADGISTDGVPPTSGQLRLRADEHGAKLSATVLRRGATLGSLTAQLEAPPRRWHDLAALADARLAVTASVGPLAVQHAGLGGQGLHHPHRVLTGRLDGRLQLGGTLREPRLSLHTALSDIRLDGRPMGQASVEAGYGSGRLQGEAHATSSNGGELQAQAQIGHTLDLTQVAAGGWQTASLGGRLSASRFDLEALSALSPRVRSVAGELAAQIDVAGTLADPQPSGSVEWRNGELTVSGLGEYRNVHVQARGDRRQWSLQALKADSGEGHADVRATGTRDDGKAGYHITSEIRFDRLPVYVEGQALADLSLDAKTQGDVARSQLRAEVDLTSARVALRDVKRKQLQPLARPGDVVVLKDGHAVGPSSPNTAAHGTDGGPNTPADGAAEPSVVVQVRGARDLWIRSNDGNIELGLDPGLRVEVGATTRIYGRVDIKRGIVTVVGQRFDLKADSSVRFNGDPSMPELDISAQYVNSGENVTVVATVKGSPGHLDTSISSPDRPDLTESQLYTLVVTGRLSLGGGSASAATPAQQAGTVLGGLLASQLQSVLAKKLPFDVLTIEGGNTAGSARVEAGKYLTPDFYVGYVGRLGADPLLLQNRNAVHLEYHLGARWSFQGEYGDAKTGSADVIWSRRY